MIDRVLSFVRVWFNPGSRRVLLRIGRLDLLTWWER